MKTKILFFIISFFLFLQNVFLFAKNSSLDLNSDLNTSSTQNITIIKVEKSRLPEIENLSYKDSLYKQYSKLLENFYLQNSNDNKNYAALKNSKNSEQNFQNKTNIENSINTNPQDKNQNSKQNPINFFLYTAKKTDTIFSIAARCNIPYDTIVSINQIQSADDSLEGKKIFLPIADGLFVLDSGLIQNSKAKNAIETFIKKKNVEKLNDFKFYCYNIEGRCFFYIPELRLDKTTRAFFLDTKMKSPLDRYWLSSDFGFRESPFDATASEKQFHKGIDMAAPVGTNVFACKSGKITSVVRLDKTFGNYIVIQHANGLSSIYAHLSKIDVDVGQSVSTGVKIGEVGKTGRVTGPHLHFEIRQNGEPTNPNNFIKR